MNVMRRKKREEWENMSAISASKYCVPVKKSSLLFAELLAQV